MVWARSYLPGIELRLDIIQNIYFNLLLSLKVGRYNKGWSTKRDLQKSLLTIRSSHSCWYLCVMGLECGSYIFPAARPEAIHGPLSASLGFETTWDKRDAKRGSRVLSGEGRNLRNLSPRATEGIVRNGLR